MKKIIYFTSLLLLYCAHVFGQAPVTNINWLPNTGDKFYIYRIVQGQFTNPYINPGDTGANVTWDFNEKVFILDNPIDSITYTTPAAIYVTPVNSQTNLAYGDSTDYVAYIKNSEGLMITERRVTFNNSPENPINLSIKTNPRLIFKNNISFRTTFYDTSIYYDHSQYNKLDSPYRGKIISVSKYDAYGTLKIADEEFTNIIRITEDMFERDSVNGVTDSIYYYSKIYTWHSSDMKNQLLQYIVPYTLKKHGSTYDTTARNPILTLKLPSSYVTGILNPSTPAQNVNAYITNNSIELRANEDIGNANYILYDLQGRILKKGSVSLFNNKTNTINTNKLPSGAYLLKIESKKGSQSFKLSKQ